MSVSRQRRPTHLVFTRIVAFVLMSAGLLGLTLDRMASAAEASACTGGWRVATTVLEAQIEKVSAISGAAWAIGDKGGGSPLIMRFDGSRWSRMFVPSIAALRAVDPAMAALDIDSIRIDVNGVYTRTATDAWIVGSAEGVDAEGQDRALPITMHWDGTAWRFVPAPSPTTDSVLKNPRLRDVLAFGPDDAWAMGYGIAMHWDGNRWTIDSRAPAAPSLARTPYAKILWTSGGSRYQNGRWTYTGMGGTDVAAVAWNDVWMVGTGDEGAAAHFDGARWSSVPTPPAAAGGYGSLSGVSAVSSRNVWAVGRQPSLNAPSRALIEHWDGTSWTIVPPPASLSTFNFSSLSDVAMRKSGWGWAVGHGDARLPDGFEHEVGLILRHCP